MMQRKRATYENTVMDLFLTSVTTLAILQLPGIVYWLGLDLRVLKCGESQATIGIFFFLKTGIIGKSGHYGKLI